MCESFVNVKNCMTKKKEEEEEEEEEKKGWVNLVVFISGASITQTKPKVRRPSAPIQI